MRYLSIGLPGRNSVREPLSPPQMRLVRDSGRVATVDLNEPELLAMLADIAETLKRFHARRDATAPPAEPQ